MWGHENFDTGLYDEVENDYKWNGHLEDDPNYEPEPFVPWAAEQAIAEWLDTHDDVKVVTRHDDGNFYDSKGRCVYGF